VQELGPQKANAINKAAVRLMSAIEMKRILKLMDKPVNATVDDHTSLEKILDTAFKLVKTDFMAFNFNFPEKNLLRGQFDQCFAYNGVKRYGMVADYDCGIVERVKSWLETLNVGYQMTPEFSGCLMHHTGKCEIDFRFDLK
ncbi:MAG: hypothetical protein KJO34_15365, partial [Deltaproteobacteria bacterium]|nr:hypothetical protein [Deltaproteobacteria bacterium]